MDGAFAVCMLVTLGFGAFIVWGRSASGRQALRQTLGEPTPRPRALPAKAKSVAMRRPATKSSPRAADKKPSERSASAPSSALKAPRASFTSTQKSSTQKSSSSPKTAPQKPTDSPRTGSPSRSRKP